jgi:phage tail P2-like protein
MTRSLLPPSRTRLERDAEQATARLGDADAPYGTLWDAWECPANLLPWLAWALGVREWSASWSEDRQRQAVASALAVRRHAGTVGAVREALKASQVDSMVLEEWFDYDGEPGHFRLSADLTGVGLSQAEFRQLVNFVLRAKRLSAHWDGIHLRSITRGEVRLAAAQQGGLAMTARPYQPGEVTTRGPASVAAGGQAGQAITLRPHQTTRLEERAPLRLGTALAAGARSTLLPYAPPRVELTPAPCWVAAASHSSTHATLYPG